MDWLNPPLSPNRSPEPLPARSWRDFVAALVLGLIGAASNMISFELFFGLQYIFGGLFTMLSLQLFGWRLGALTAFVASISMLFLWQSPAAILFLTVKAIVVGYLYEKRRCNLLIADLIFWGIFGVPLVICSYVLFYDLTFISSVLITSKQVLNSLINTLLAMLILLALVQKLGGHWLYRCRTSYQELLFTLLLAFSLMPSITILAYLDRQINHELEQEIVAHFANVKEQIAPLMKHWLDENYLILGSVAVNAMSVVEQQQRLDLLQATDRDFASIAIIDKDLRVVARSPRNDDLGELVIGQDFSGQEHLRKLKETLHPTVTGLVQRDVGRNEPASLVLVPLVKNGQFNGCVTGVVKTKALAELLEILTKRWQGHYYLLDRHERVIVTDQEKVRVMDPLPPLPTGTIRQIAAGIRLWTPVQSQLLPNYERLQQFKYIARIALPIPGNWSLQLETPIAPLRARMVQNYLNSSLLALAMVLPSVIIARWLSRRLLKTTDQLGEISADLPLKIAQNDFVRWPESRIVEVARLIDNFRQMENSLRQKFGELSVSYQNLQRESAKRQLLEDRHAQLRVTHEQEERMRISRELHDGIGQALAAAKMKLEEVASSIPPPSPVTGRINDIIADLARTNAELRDIVYTLRPSFFETMSLCDAVRWYSRRIATATLEIEIDAAGADCRMPEEVKYQLYRIIQEAIFNGVKHAAASIIQVTFRSSLTHLCIEVWDDGRGGVTADASAGQGLKIMGERVELLKGNLGIVSPPGDGTTIIIEVPLTWPLNES